MPRELKGCREAGSTQIHIPVPQGCSQLQEKQAPLGWRITGLTLGNRVWRDCPGPGLLQAGWGGDTDPAACLCLSWEHPPP